MLWREATGQNYFIQSFVSYQLPVRGSRRVPAHVGAVPTGEYTGDSSLERWDLPRPGGGGGAAACIPKDSGTEAAGTKTQYLSFHVAIRNFISLKI